MNCPCVHAGKSANCQAIECPSYLWALCFGNRFIRRFAVVLAVVMVAGVICSCTDRDRVDLGVDLGTALDEFWARPLPDAPQVVYYGGKEPSPELQSRLAMEYSGAVMGAQYRKENPRGYALAVEAEHGRR